MYIPLKANRKFISHCVKIVHIPSFSGPYFPASGINTERYGVSLRIQSESGKIRTRKTPNTDNFHGVSLSVNFEEKHFSCSLVPFDLDVCYNVNNTPSKSIDGFTKY